MGILATGQSLMQSDLVGVDGCHGAASMEVKDQVLVFLII